MVLAARKLREVGADRSWVVARATTLRKELHVDGSCELTPVDRSGEEDRGHVREGKMLENIVGILKARKNAVSRINLVGYRPSYLPSPFL